MIPLAIALGGMIAIGFICFSYRQSLLKRAGAFGSAFSVELDIAGMKTKPEEIGYIVFGVSAALWIAAVFVLRPNPIVGVLMIPMLLGFCAYAAKRHINGKVKGRIKAFQGQLEGMLRSISGGLRVGLGLRQALIHVGEQSEDPARRELARVVGATNVGVPVFDAIDEMGVRFPTSEMQMLARAIRVQANAGGNLAEVLLALADTIRDRRRLERKIAALTAQGKATAFVLGGLPLAVLAFLLMFQPLMRDAMLHTIVGNISLGVGLGLDGLGIMILLKMAKLDV
ncbi:MAG: hypothetical protein NVSMB5_04050 [Candidatus Velthaea sp.]